MQVKLQSQNENEKLTAAPSPVSVAASAPKFHPVAGAAGSENATMKKYTLEYLAVYRAGKSQYQGAFVYQIEALVNGKREVWMEHAVNTIREAKRNYEGHLNRRFE